MQIRATPGSTRPDDLPHRASMNSAPVSFDNLQVIYPWTVHITVLVVSPVPIVHPATSLKLRVHGVPMLRSASLLKRGMVEGVWVRRARLKRGITPYVVLAIQYGSFFQGGCRSIDSLEPSVWSCQPVVGYACT